MNIGYCKQAKKSFERLDATTKQRIRNDINQLPAGDIKKLKGYANLYRLRVGDWRVLFSYEQDDIIRINKIAPRGEVSNLENSLTKKAKSANSPSKQRQNHQKPKGKHNKANLPAADFEKGCWICGVRRRTVRQKWRQSQIAPKRSI